MVLASRPGAYLRCQLVESVGREVLACRDTHHIAVVIYVEGDKSASKELGHLGHLGSERLEEEKFQVGIHGLGVKARVGPLESLNVPLELGDKALAELLEVGFQDVLDAHALSDVSQDKSVGADEAEAAEQEVEGATAIVAVANNQGGEVLVLLTSIQGRAVPVSVSGNKLHAGESILSEEPIATERDGGVAHLEGQPLTVEEPFDKTDCLGVRSEHILGADHAKWLTRVHTIEAVDSHRISITEIQMFSTNIERIVRVVTFACLWHLDLRCHLGLLWKTNIYESAIILIAAGNQREGFSGF